LGIGIAVGSQEERLPFGCLLPQDGREVERRYPALRQGLQQGTTGIRRRFGEGGEVGYFLLLGLRVRGVLVLVVSLPLARAFEFPQTLAEPLGNIGQLLASKEKQGNKENEQ
jgi:hypothetical protein